jgi:hypothetical protein
MRLLRIAVAALIATAFAAAPAQKWVGPYERGLTDAKRDKWAEARESFAGAIKERADDSDKPSTVGAGLTERRPWREGAPYSPNFAVAYCTFKLAAQTNDAAQRAAHLKSAIEGFQALLAKGQRSVESTLFLAAAYVANNQSREGAEVQEALSKMDPAKAYRVDQEVIDFDDLRLMESIIRGTSSDTGALSLPGADNPFGIVPALDFKFAVLVGNSSNGPSFGGNDVDLLHESLTKHAGYMDTNVVSLKNVSRADYFTAVNQLSERLPEGATVVVFFTGPARKDPAGSDLLGFADGAFVSKSEVLSPIVKKGANIFAFYQVDRSFNSNGQAFGSEIPAVGKIAQCMAAAPGELVNPVIVEGKSHGAYAYAFASVLRTMRNNRIVISEFVWLVFDAVRRGSAEGGGGAQTPTLPVYVGLSSTSKF